MSNCSSESGAALTANENDLSVSNETCPGDNDWSLVSAVNSAWVDVSAPSMDADGSHIVLLSMLGVCCTGPALNATDMTGDA